MLRYASEYEAGAWGNSISRWICREVDESRGELDNDLIWRELLERKVQVGTTPVLEEHTIGPAVIGNWVGKSTCNSPAAGRELARVVAMVQEVATPI